MKSISQENLPLGVPSVSKETRHSGVPNTVSQELRHPGNASISSEILLSGESQEIRQIGPAGEPSGVPVAPSSPKGKSGPQAPTSASNEDEPFQSLSGNAAANVEWTTEHGFVTHLRFQEQKFEVLDVKADGNCFYSMISVGLAFNEKFLSMQAVKRDILTHMQELWEAKSKWFKELYSQFAPPALHDNFHGYIRQMSKDHEWSSMLERDIASVLFK